MTGRHAGYWCRTTLFYRDWSHHEIERFLVEPDLIDQRRQVTGNYFAIPRVLAAEAKRNKRREFDRRLAELDISPVTSAEPQRLNKSSTNQLLLDQIREWEPQSVEVTSSCI